jgi:hypothetical protein
MSVAVATGKTVAVAGTLGATVAVAVFCGTGVGVLHEAVPPLAVSMRRAWSV